MDVEVGVILHVPAQFVDGGEFESLPLCNFKDAGTLGGIEELAPLVEQFERVPLLRVVAGGQDDSAIGLFERHRNLHRWGG